jgi:serine O-acetyltransferase
MNKKSQEYKFLFKVIKNDYIVHQRRILSFEFLSLFIYRIGQFGMNQKNSLARFLIGKVYGVLSRIVAGYTKVWIPREVIIGEGFHIIHAEGSISIHPSVIIGERCGIMHNTTIGTNMHSRGCPVIGDDVFIGVGSTILGNIRIGDRVRIGANTAITTNIPSDSIAIGSPAKIYPRLTPFVRG